MSRTSLNKEGISRWEWMLPEEDFPNGTWSYTLTFIAEEEGKPVVDVIVLTVEREGGLYLWYCAAKEGCLIGESLSLKQAKKKSWERALLILKEGWPEDEERYEDEEISVDEPQTGDGAE